MSKLKTFGIISFAVVAILSAGIAIAIFDDAQEHKLLLEQQKACGVIAPAIAMLNEGISFHSSTLRAARSEGVYRFHIEKRLGDLLQCALLQPDVGSARAVLSWELKEGDLLELSAPLTLGTEAQIEVLEVKIQSSTVDVKGRMPSFLSIDFPYSHAHVGQGMGSMVIKLGT